MDTPYLAGSDKSGRKVYVEFLPNWQDLLTLNCPSSPYVLFLAGSSEKVRDSLLIQITKHFLDDGAVFVAVWGKGAPALEEIFDNTIIMSEDKKDVVTTSHPDESLEDTLDFVTNGAFPAEHYSVSCQTLFLLFVDNVNWYNNALIHLEDSLHAA